MSEPLDDPATRALYSELTDAEPSLATQVGLVIGPLAGWVTVADFDDDPRFCKILWYLAEPEVAMSHVQTTDFELDLDGGGPAFSQEYGAGEHLVRYHAVGDGPTIPIAYLRTGGEGSPPEWRTTELADDFRLFWSLYEDQTSGE